MTFALSLADTVADARGAHLNEAAQGRITWAKADPAQGPEIGNNDIAWKEDMKKHAMGMLAGAAMLCAGAAVADEHGHAHHAFAKDIDAFHAALAPVWHSMPGPGRSRNACAKTGEMARLAAEIKSADASQLAAAVATLKAKCGAKPGEVDGALYDVHEAFHRLIG